MITSNEWVSIIGLFLGIIGSIFLAFSIKTKSQTTLFIVEGGKSTSPSQTTINKSLFILGIILIVIGFISQIIYTIIT
jgi:hypothetical protein